MNVHHLELFYYVAKYEGITEAVRKMPYGIQQPAVSGQILQLEKDLGVKLFHRRPFALTPSGEDLYDYAYSFFSRMEAVEERLRGEERYHLRLAASASALTHHLPDILQELRREFPNLKLTLREVKNGDLEAALQRQEADVAVAILAKHRIPGVKSIPLIDLPLTLAIPENCSAESFDDLCAAAKGGEIDLPLLSLPKSEPVSEIFQSGLTAMNLRWEPSMEVSELGLILSYVARGFGIGIAVDIPGAKWPKEIRKISLPEEFAPLSIGAIHTSELKPVAQRFIELTKALSTGIQST